MNNTKRTELLYDVELYKNYFCATFYSYVADQYKLFQWSDKVNDIPELIKLVTNTDPVRTLVSYNGLNYDDCVLNHIIRNYKKGLTIYSLWEFSQKLIREEIRNPYRYNSKFKSIDCMEILRVGRFSKPLKSVAVNLKFPKIQEMPVDYDKEMDDNDIVEIISYNKNDVDILKYLFEYLEQENELEMRRLLSEQYNLDLYTDAESKIAKSLFNKFYFEKALEKNPDIDTKALSKLRTHRTRLELKDLILPTIQFKTDELKAFHQTLTELSIVKEKNKNNEDKESFVCPIPNLSFGGIDYTIALGGIHSVDKPLIIETGEDDLLLDLDKFLV